MAFYSKQIASNRPTMIAANVNRTHMEEPVIIAGQAPVEPKRRLLQVKGIKKNACRRRKWVEALGIGKEMMHIVTIVRSLRLDFRCFGAVPAPSSSSSSSSSSEVEEEDADLEDVEGNQCKDSNAGIESNDGDQREENEKMNESEEQEGHAPSLAQDVHVIKRCVSAPAKGWQACGDNQNKEDDDGDEETKAGELLADKVQQANQEQSQRLMLMSYAPDFFRVTPDIEKKTWNKKSACLLHRSLSLMR